MTGGYGKPGWQVWEEDVASIVGGDLVKASGRLTGYKGDVKTGNLLIDCKYTETERYSLSSKMWRSVSEWATNEMRVPMIAVRFASGCEVGVMRLRDYEHIASEAAKPHRTEGVLTIREFEAYNSKGVRMSLGISSRSKLPMTAHMTQGVWNEEVVAMELSRMLKAMGINED